MSDHVVVDSHALIWWASGEQRRLTRFGRRLFERAAANRATIHISVLSIVEVLESAHRGRTRIPGGGDAWLAGVLGSGSYHVENLTREIVVAAQSLYAIPERGDRLIAATAVHLGLPLLTRDPAIAAAAQVEHIW